VDSSHGVCLFAVLLYAVIFLKCIGNINLDWLNSVAVFHSREIPGYYRDYDLNLMSCSLSAYKSFS
jgi:hypothetical protein